MADIPPLPEGYTLDGDVPPVPKGYALESASPPEQSGGLGQFASDAGRFAMTAATRGLGATADFAMDPLAPLRHLVSPDLERIEQSAKPHPGQTAGDAVFNATGVPEYQPTTPLGRVGLSAAEGAVGSGPFGVGSAIAGAISGLLGQSTQELTGNERLATAAGMLPGVAGGVRAGMRDNSPVPPSAEALKAAGSAGYDAARNSGLEFHGHAVADMARGLQTGLEAKGIIAERAPETFALINRLTSPPGAVGGTTIATLDGLMSSREAFSEIARDYNAKGADRLAATRAIRSIDNFLENPDPQAVAGGKSAAQIVPNPGGGFDIHTNGPAGVLYATDIGQAQRMAAQYGGGVDPGAVASTLKDARGNYAAAQRSNDLTGTLDRATTGILERAENRAQATNSGKNLDNAIRQRIASLLEKPKEIHGYSDAEIEALNKVLQGGPVRNTARRVGNLFGGGGGIGQSAIALGTGVAGGQALGPWGMALGLAPAAIGSSAKALENALARRSLRQADETVRSTSPLYREQLAQPFDPRTAAVLRALLPGLISAPRQPTGGLYGSPSPGGLFGGYF